MFVVVGGGKGKGDAAIYGGKFGGRLLGMVSLVITLEVACVVEEIEKRSL